jgi:arylsulfatase A-like enzyme
VRRRPARAIVVPAVLTLVVLTAGLVTWFGRSHPRNAGSPRPNFVFILTDDQRWDSLSTTPEIRSLIVDHGLSFRNAFVTTSSCCPSRSSILTGQYSHTTGVLDGSAAGRPGGAPAFKDKSTLATWLHDDGYTTGLVGKYLNDFALMPPGYVPPGWDEFDAMAQPHHESRYYDYQLDENGKVVRYGSAPNDYNTTVLQQKATAFIERASDPFFLYFATTAPHLPATPAPGDAGRLRNVPWHRPPSFNERDVSDKPEAAKLPPLTEIDIKHIRDRRERQLESMLAVDRAVKAIFDEVSAKGELNSTYFIFTSDNGFLYGEHRLSGKIWPYEESIRVPMVIRAPGMNAPRTDDHIALNIDLAPTIAELAGIRPGLPEDGRSLVPFLQGRSPPWRKDFIEEFLGDGQGVPRFVAVRTTRYLYVEYFNGWRELYDLRKDPYELENLAGTTRAAGLQAALASRLRALYPGPTVPPSR